MADHKFSLVLVDDDTSTLQALERVLRPHFVCHSFTEPELALSKLREISPAIIIADGSMPKMHGILFLQECQRANPASVRVLLSGNIETDSVKTHLESETIHRFFLKPWDNQVLQLQMLECLHLHFSLKKQHELSLLALIDPLTELHNKRSFQEKIQIELDRSQRTRIPVSLLMIDVDHFKSLNDKLGHIEADKILKGITQQMKSKLRSTDWLFRFGGDEFASLLPGASSLLAGEIAERLRTTVEKTYQSPNLVTVSIGASTYPDLALNSHQLLESADHALYEAKNTGRNKTIIASKN